LVQHAADFARTHWQSAHTKPYFLEISADMLRYVPFAAKAGMIYVGETEGNLKRIVKDLNYLEANEKRFQKEIFIGESFGILDTKFSQLAKANAAKKGDKKKRIGTFIKQQLDHPTLDGWAKLTGVLSHPKPHYMMGLNEEATELIARRVISHKIMDPFVDDNFYINQVYRTRLTEPVRIQKVSFEKIFSVKRTEITHHIERAFEISLDNLVQPILKNFSIEIQPGEIIVVTGLSGTGKTTLLKLLASELTPTTGSIDFPKNTFTSKLHEISCSKPLIEVISKKDPGKGIFWLGVVGLSESFLYVKPFHALSAGQKYRAMIAKLLVSGANLWLMDEFCENLDLVNTNLLAQKIVSVAHKVGATVVVASSDTNRFIKALRPDRVLVLRGATINQSFQILTGEKYIDQIKIWQ
jgi:ABC-type ATPase with predicted acetyltransferase domain